MEGTAVAVTNLAAVPIEKTPRWPFRAVLPGGQGPEPYTVPLSIFADCSQEWGMTLAGFEGNSLEAVS